MPDSGDYYNLYITHKQTVTKLKENINSLNSIRNKILNNFDDEQRNVNKKIGNLQDDLDKAVRHDETWKDITSICEDDKENNSESDVNLKAALESLDAELSSLSIQKENAESERDQAYKDYEREKDEEYRRWVESLKQLF